MADTMKMEYKIFLEAEDVSQSRILSCASYMKRVLESCNNPYISRAELDDESDLDDFVLRLFVEEEIEEKECTNPAMAESFIEDMAELVEQYPDVLSGVTPYVSVNTSVRSVAEKFKRICLCFPRR